MKNNQPITQNEVVLNDAAHLVSSTNTKGQITYCNQAFIDISGFSKEELLGSAHNIVRHPDMPEAAFALMWEKLKNGQPWQGLVKNRCANGNFYWVDAYVTPVLDKGLVVGYESVRTKPKPEKVERAIEAYRRLREKQSPIPSYQQVYPWLMTLMPWFIALAGLFILNDNVLTNFLLILPLMAWSGIRQQQQNTVLENIAKQVTDDALAAYIYSGKNSPSAKLDFAQHTQKRRLQTVLVRIKDNMSTLSTLAQSARQISDDNLEQVQRQNEETDQLAQASHQITQSAEILLKSNGIH